MCVHRVAQAKAYGGEESGTCYFSLVRSQLMQKAKRPWGPGPVEGASGNPSGH